jgi:hypothetical protein
VSKVIVTPVSWSIPVETDSDRSNGIPDVYNNVQLAIEYVSTAVNVSASPGFTWGRPGTTTSGTYLENDQVASNLSGRLVPFDGYISEFFVSNKNSTAGRVIDIMRRRPAQTGTWTVIGTLSLGLGEPTKVQSFTIAVLREDELAVRISPTSANFKDPIVGVVIKTNPLAI